MERIEPTVRIAVLLLLLAASGSASGAAAQEVDLGGTWSLTILGKSPTGEEEAELVFERDGFNLDVTMRSASGEVDCMGYIDGNEIRFYYIREGRKGRFVAKFTGHVRGDLMGGEVEMGKKGTTTWKARRGSEKNIDLSGVWTLQLSDEDAPADLNLAKMKIRQDDHRVVVTFDTGDATLECDGFIDDDVITFYCVRPLGSGESLLRFTGQLGGAVIGGRLEIGASGETTWMATQDV